MSSVILPKVGAFVGGSVAGPFGAAFGQVMGREIGSELDKQLFLPKLQPSIGTRIASITMQTATYGKMIPIVYGTVKLAGNIIWASQIRETRHDHYQRQGKFSSRRLVASNFSYSISLAIAICEGEIDEILRVWANDLLIDPKRSNYRFYPGSETQMPDPLIEAMQGYGATPAFRGLAYVVIEDLALADFHNHIPNFLFEVKRQVKVNNNEEVPLEDRLKAMVIIPGSGEFVYDTVVQSKASKNYNPKYGNFNLQTSKINQNNRHSKADSLVSLKQLETTCPNLQWVAPVVGWFATDLNIKKCDILPGVEQKEIITMPDQWQVAGFNRDTAYLISRDQYGNPIYGGTSNDLAILRYLDSLGKYKIMFYPMIFVDQSNKPWRGRITGRVEDIPAFFKKYNKFILHYARLVKGKVNAFLIGSELIGLTKLKDKNNNFPAVDALIDLAKQVKEILGHMVKVSYAADWSEYHHCEGGWYNLDKLWACDYIDFVGIDAYFPLTNEQQSFYDEDKIIKSWQAGEGYDYYYVDEHKTTKHPLGAAYAWKNIAYWWNNKHINPDGKATNWQPKQKKIWFTELGFPSVDLASNQPNVFYCPGSQESKFPLHSKGEVDFIAQRQALSATEKYWRNSEFLEQIFIWTWDARPFPFWPDLSQVWRDGDCWLKGHWVNGKLGLTKLEAVIQDLAKRCNLEYDQLNAKELYDLVDGLVIHNQDSGRDIINQLKTAYFFDSHEVQGKLHFIRRRSKTCINIAAQDLIVEQTSEFYPISIKKIAQLPKSVAVHYMNSFADYNRAIEFSGSAYSPEKINIHLPMMLDPQKARSIAQRILQEISQGQYIYQFSLIAKEIKPNDIIHLKWEDKILKMRVLTSKLKKVNQITAISIGDNNYYNKTEVSPRENILLAKDHFDPGETELIMLNLPRLPYEVAPFGVYLGVIGNDKHWRGAEVECPDGSLLYFEVNSKVGRVEVMEDDCLEVILFHGELASKPAQELERFANLAAIGEEVIQFARAEFLGENRYCLTGLKRELFNSKKDDSDRFVLLDRKLQKLPVSEMQKGKMQRFIITSVGSDERREQEFLF